MMIKYDLFMIFIKINFMTIAFIRIIIMIPIKYLQKPKEIYFFILKVL
jgi:hypothetical protein